MVAQSSTSSTNTSTTSSSSSTGAASLPPVPVVPPAEMDISAYGWLPICPTRLPDIAQATTNVQRYCTSNGFRWIGDPLLWRTTKKGVRINLRNVQMPVGWGIMYAATPKEVAPTRGFVVDNLYRTYIYFETGDPSHVRSGIYPIFDRLKDYLQMDPRLLVYYKGWFLPIGMVCNPTKIDQPLLNAVGLGDEKQRHTLAAAPIGVDVLKSVKPHTPNKKNAYHHTCGFITSRNIVYRLPLLMESVNNTDDTEPLAKRDRLTTATTAEIGSTTSNTASASTGSSSSTDSANSAAPKQSRLTGGQLAWLDAQIVAAATDGTVDTNGKVQAKAGPRVEQPPQYFDEETQSIKQDPLKFKTEATGELDEIGAQMLPILLKGICLQDSSKTEVCIADVARKTMNAYLTVLAKQVKIELSPVVSTTLMKMAIADGKTHNSADGPKKALELIKQTCANMTPNMQSMHITLYKDLYVRVFAAVEKFVNMLDPTTDKQYTDDE